MGYISNIGVLNQLSVFNGLQNYWRMEDANDALGARNLSTYTISYEAGMHNNCLKFGTNGYARFTTGTTDTTFRNQTFSFGGWVYSVGTSGYNIMWSHDYTSHSAPYYAVHLRFYYTATPKTYLTFYINRSGVAKGFDIDLGTPASINNIWYHIFVTVTPNRFILYLNGVNVRENTTNTGNITYYNQNGQMGMSPNFSSTGNAFKMDEWGYWLRELEAREIKALYNAGAGKFY